MTQKKSDITNVAQKLVSLRLGEIPYNKIKKKEIWELLQVLIEKPILGLVDDGDDGSYQAELKRVINVYMSPDGISPEASISVIGGSLNYDTLLVFNRLIHYYLGLVAEAYDVLKTRPGEIDHLSDLMNSANKRISASSDEIKETPVEVSFLLLVSMLNLVSRMGSDAEYIIDLIPTES